MHLFYTPDIEGSVHVLDDIESRHAVKVLRLKNGDRINLINGLGTWLDAKIVDGNPKKCKLEILSKKENHKPLSYHLHVGIAPTKNIDRFEWFVEKATEIGISEITPLLCEHSERKKLRADRIEKVMIAAMKQSLKAYKPILNPITPFSEWVQIPFRGSRAIGYCKDTDLTPLWDLPAQNGLLMAI
jgi:16S rRNA (uracil1498-N3)-methyltransferase